MTNREHLLAIVEPTTGGDATLELARETVARGGRATVLMVVTDRVQRDLRAYANSAELGKGEAEAIALDRMRARCRDHVGGSVGLDTHYGPLGSDLVKYVSADTTSIAIPAHLVSDRLVERVAVYSGRPVIVAPGATVVPAAPALARLAS